MTVLLLLGAASQAFAQANVLPDVGEPLLRLEAGGPTSDVTALALAPDGQTLYAAGWDKVVRVWKRDARTGEFVPQRISFRVPIGPGLHGAVNALALSADGRWLAVGGLGVFRGQAGFRLPGLVVPAAGLTPSMREDEGAIFIFDTSNPGAARELRGHRGPVLGLVFVHQDAKLAPLLVSAARDWKDEQQVGAVRLWDLDKTKTLAELTGLPDPVNRLPGIAALRSGPQPTQVRVALAWGEGDFNRPGKLRFWDAERQPATAAAAEDGRFDNTVVYLPTSGQLLTGSWRREDLEGQLRAWNPAADAPKPGSVEATFLHQDRTVFFPRALALVSSKSNGNPDYAAVVLRVVPREEYRLGLAPLGTPSTYQVDATLPLWKGGRLPVLATASRGDFLAVAGAPDNGIRVFALRDLLAGKATPQVLHSIGEQINYAAFVRKGDGKNTQRGFVLSTQGPPGAGAEALRQGDMILEVATRKLIADLRGWSLDSPAVGGWSYNIAPAKADVATQIVVTSPKRENRTISIPEGRAITRHALLPPLAPLNLPVLAVASSKGDEPVLSLYDAASGDLICQFSGHLGPITSLAFSGDGRFLLSAARDQTVCLWSLVGLDKFVGKQGQLAGLVVQKDDGGGLVVSDLVADGPAKQLLKKGEVVEGLGAGEKFQKLASPPEFYNALLAYAPGKEATLRLRGGREVKVPVSQAAQERTPLLALFITRGGRVQDREWLAWSPLGPYDSSTPRMARAFGWHLNTGKTTQPVTFTPADEARSGERRVGLLKYVLARGSLAPALEDYDRAKKLKPLPPPQMTLGIDDMEGQLVRQAKGTLRLHVEGLEPDRIGSIQWRLDDAPFRTFAEQAPEEKAVDCTQPLDLARGAHKIQVRLRTKEEAAQEFTRDLAVSYLPREEAVKPRPVLPKTELTASPAGPTFFDEGQGPPELQLGGKVFWPQDPPPAGMNLTATVLLNSKEFPATLAADQKSWSTKVRLEPRHNRLQVKLASAGQQAVFGDLELDYLRPPRNLRASLPDTTSNTRLDLTATVDSVLPLTPRSIRATINGRPLADTEVTGPAGPQWNLRLKLPLDPGRNQIELDVVNAEGGLREPASLEVTFVPPKPPPAPPLVTLLQPETTATPNELTLKVSRPDLPVRFQIRSSEPLERVALLIRRPGQPLESKAFDPKQASKSATGFELTAGSDLHLPPGVTTLVLQARNPGGTGSSPALLVNYVPPPVQVVLESFEPAEGEGPRQAIQQDKDGKFTCPALGSARLWLHGKVLWGQADALLTQRQKVRVYINGAQQWRGELTPAEGALERHFKAAVVLNRPTNLIEVDLPQLPLAESTVRGMLADCRNPLAEQWLHVQIISPDEPDEPQLIQQVLQTLQAANYSPAKGEFSRPGFARARMYRPLVEDVDQDKVVFRLLSIKRQIAQRSREGWPNDVVLVYYLGGETVDKEGQLVSLTQGEPPQPLITAAQLEREFADMLGVKVLLLDVTRARSGGAIAVENVRREVARWLDEPSHFAWMRAAWVGSGPIPQQARLLVALQAVLPGAPRLGDVTQRLDQRFRVLTERFGSLRGDWYLPPPLSGLALESNARDK
jgi:WD40 repeat protein